MLKSKLRKEILKIRENTNFTNIRIDFSTIINLFKKEKINKKNIGGYYPVNFEFNDLHMLKEFEKKKIYYFFTKSQKKF